MNDFPNNLRKIRTTQTNKELRSGSKIAELLEVTPQYYYKLETGKEGKRPNIEHLNKLMKIFNVSADEILGKQGLGSEEKEFTEQENHNTDRVTPLSAPQKLNMFFRTAEELTDDEMREIHELMQFKISRRKKDGDSN